MAWCLSNLRLLQAAPASLLECGGKFDIAKGIDYVTTRCVAYIDFACRVAKSKLLHADNDEMLVCLQRSGFQTTSIVIAAVDATKTVLKLARVAEWHALGHTGECQRENSCAMLVGSTCNGE